MKTALVERFAGTSGQHTRSTASSADRLVSSPPERLPRRVQTAEGRRAAPYNLACVTVR